MFRRNDKLFNKNVVNWVQVLVERLFDVWVLFQQIPKHLDAALFVLKKDMRCQFKKCIQSILIWEQLIRERVRQMCD
jgi:hypothetical protein